MQHFFDHGCYAAFARYVPFTQPFNADIGVAIWDPDDSYHINVAYNVPAQNYGQFMDSPSVWLGYWSSNKWFHARADVTNTANGCRMTGDTANHDDDNGGTSGSDWNWVQC